jgi:histidinol dehydrogenase
MLSSEQAAQLAEAAATLADAEGLPTHAKALRARKKRKATGD